MTTTQLLKTARSAIGLRIKYKLGSGGMNPKAASPAGKDGACDCSGFVAWCLGISRLTDNPFYKQFNGGWVNTDAIVRDAQSPFGFFEEISCPELGCLIVYGKQKGMVAGHVGIVSGLKPERVIHCSSGNWKTTGDAINETGAEIFHKHKAIYVRSAFVSS